MNIEELAFKDRRTLAQLNGLVLLDIIEFLQLDRKQWINQFTQTHNESIEIQKENKQLKMINKEYERLNKENGRGFKITNVQEYDIYELLSYKDNWNKLKEYVKENLYFYSGLQGEDLEINDEMKDILNKMQELEKGSDSNG